MATWCRAISSVPTPPALSLCPTPARKSSQRHVDRQRGRQHHRRDSRRVRNVISGNRRGIAFSTTTTGYATNWVEGNFIGTDVTALPRWPIKARESISAAERPSRCRPSRWLAVRCRGRQHDRLQWIRRCFRDLGDRERRVRETQSSATRSSPTAAWESTSTVTA